VQSRRVLRAARDARSSVARRAARRAPSVPGHPADRRRLPSPPPFEPSRDAVHVDPRRALSRAVRAGLSGRRRRRAPRRRRGDAGRSRTARAGAPGGIRLATRAENSASISRMRQLILTVAFVSTATLMPLAHASKQFINEGPSLGLPFSSAVKAGGLVYVSGAIAVDASGKVIAGDVKAQTRQLLETMDARLKAGGSSLANAASVLVYLANAS